MIPEIPRWIIAARSARTKRTSRKAIQKRRWRAKAPGKEAKLSYSGNLLVENRNGLIVDSRVWEATGTAERYAALEMLQELPGSGRVTVGGDKGFDTADFVRECRNMWVTPHVAQNLGRRGGSAIVKDCPQPSRLVKPNAVEQVLKTRIVAERIKDGVDL